MIHTLTRFIVSASMVFSLVLAGPALAAAVPTEGGGVNPSDFGYQNVPQYFGQNKEASRNSVLPTGTSYKDPRTLAQNIINIILGFLGIVAVVIVLFAGFQWMTSGGEEEKVKEAQQRLIQGAIGMALILAAWMIAYFVIDQLVGAIQK